MDILRFLRKKLNRPRKTIYLTEEQLIAISESSLITDKQKEIIEKLNGNSEHAEKFRIWLQKVFVENKIGLVYMVSPGRREKIQESNRNRKWSNEDKIKMSSKMSGRKNPMEGVKHSEAVRKIISNNNLNREDNRGKEHYLFKGSDANNPRGEAWYRKRKEYVAQRKSDDNYYCDLCGEELYEDDSITIVHHIIEVKKVIDIIQDINYSWNLMLFHRGCHTSIHNWLRRMYTSLTDDQKAWYRKVHNRAVKKMKVKIKEARDV